MRGKTIRTAYVIALCLVAGILIRSLPAGAIGGSCSKCRGGYESCMQDAYDSGFISPQEEEFCSSLTAACWNNCQALEYQYCSYSYDFCLGQGSGSPYCTPLGCYSGEAWQINHQASACSNYVSWGATLNCEPWP